MYFWHILFEKKLCFADSYLHNCEISLICMVMTKGKSANGNLSCRMPFLPILYKPKYLFLTFLLYTGVSAITISIASIPSKYIIFKCVYTWLKAWTISFNMMYNFMIFHENCKFYNKYINMFYAYNNNILGVNICDSWLQV